MRALRDMLESVARTEDIVKVYEARLTEKETTSLSPAEVDDYILTLKVHFNTFFHTHITIFLAFSFGPLHPSPSKLQLV